MSIFIIYYILFFFISFLLIPKVIITSDINKEKLLQTQNYVFLVFLTLAFFGLGLVGYDTKNYYTFFDETKTISTFSFSDYNKEYLFFFLISICKSLGISYVWFRFIYMFLDFVLLYIGFQYFLDKRLLPFAFIIYWLFGGMNFSIDFIRNGKSLCFFLLAIKELDKKNKKKFIFFCICSFFFHVTAIILILLIFLYKIFLKKKLVRFLVILGIIISILGFGLGRFLLIFQNTMPGQIGILLNMYANNAYNTAHGFSLGMIERVISFYIVFKYQDKLLKDYSFAKYFITYMYIYVLICFYFLDFTIIYERLASLYKIGYWILFPILFDYQNGKKKNSLYAILFFYGL